MANVMASQPGVSAHVRARDRTFYTGMAAAILLIVLAGFAPTYFARLLTAEGPTATVSGLPFTPLLHLHGVLFTAWVVLFLVQTALVAGGRVRLHRRLGIGGALLAVLMVVVGVSTAIAAARAGAAPAGVDPRAFLIIPLGDLALFSLFTGGALRLRRDSEAHKRLMLLASISILVAAVARLPGVLPLGPPVFFGLTFLLVGAGIVYDRASRGRVHPVYLWGGGLLVLSVPVRLALSGTAAWHALAEFMMR
jgi:hypothetical protein